MTVASCKSTNTHLFGLGVFTVHMYIASKLLSSESSACTLCGDFVNASTAFTSSIVCTFVLCGFVRHLLVKCPYFRHFLHWNLDVGQLNPGLCLHSIYICLDRRMLEILFVLFLSLSMWLPFWGVDLNGFFVGWLCKC